MKDTCGLLGGDLDARDMIESPQIIGISEGGNMTAHFKRLSD